MSELRRWPVLEHHAVTDHDVADGCVTPEALQAWALSVREDYLSQNHELHRLLGHGLHLDYDLREVADSCLRLGAPARVAVSAGVTEVRPDSFTLTTRIRTLGGNDELAVDVSTTVRLVADDGSVQELDPGVRDAIGALEAGAGHLN